MGSPAATSDAQKRRAPMRHCKSSGAHGKSEFRSTVCWRRNVAPFRVLRRGCLPWRHLAAVVMFALAADFASQARASFLDPRIYGHDSSDASKVSRSMVQLSVGIEVQGGEVERCVARGHLAPLESCRLLVGSQLPRDQLRVVAGERERGRDNIELGVWQVSDTWRKLLASPPPMNGPPPLVLLCCSVDVDGSVLVAMETLHRKRSPDPTLQEVQQVLFKGPMGISASRIADHLVEVDELDSEISRRNTADARHAFEDLILTLWRSVDQRSDGQSMHSDDELKTLETLIDDGLKVLVETAGVHQVPHFWEHLENAVRKRVALEGEEPRMPTGDDSNGVAAAPRNSAESSGDSEWDDLSEY